MVYHALVLKADNSGKLTSVIYFHHQATWMNKTIWLKQELCVKMGKDKDGCVTVLVFGCILHSFVISASVK